MISNTIFPRLQVLSNFQMLVHVLFLFMLVLALVLVLVLMLVLVQALELLRHSGIVTGTGHSWWWSWWRWCMRGCHRGKNVVGNKACCQSYSRVEQSW